MSTPTGWRPRPFGSRASVPINRYFHNHPEMVLGAWSRKDTLYGGDTAYSVLGSGDLAEQLAGAVAGYPPSRPSRRHRPATEPAPPFVPPPAERHITEGSFFVGDDRVIRQVQDGQAVTVSHGALLRADGTMMGKRLAGLIGLRDCARRVLQSQNEGWPESTARRPAAN